MDNRNRCLGGSQVTGHVIGQVMGQVIGQVTGWVRDYVIWKGGRWAENEK